MTQTPSLMSSHRSPSGSPQLAPTLTEQECDLHKPSERVQLIAGFPHHPDFVVVEEARFLAILLFDPLIPLTTGVS